MWIINYIIAIISFCNLHSIFTYVHKIEEVWLFCKLQEDKNILSIWCSASNDVLHLLSAIVTCFGFYMVVKVFFLVTVTVSEIHEFSC